MSSPISPVRSFACAPISPCRCRGFISSATRVPMSTRAIAITARPSAFSRGDRAPRTPASSVRPASSALASSDRASADAEIVRLATEAVREAGLKRLRLRFGDIALFYALLDALALPERWRLKLRHYFWRPPEFHALLGRLAKGERPEGNGAIAELAATLEGGDPARAEDLVAEYLEAKGLPLSGNRTLGEITERLLDYAADLRADPLPKEVATVIDYYLAVAAPPREGVDRVAMIAKGAGIDLTPGARGARPPLRSLRAKAASILRPRASRPSSAGASNITPASCSRSKPRAVTPRPRSRAAAAMTACSAPSARRSRCRRSAPPSTPSGCSRPFGRRPR